MKLEFESRRLILKTLDARYADQVLAYYNKNASFLEPWEPEKMSYFFTSSFQARMLKQEQKDLENLNAIRFWLFKKEDPSIIIGTVAFSNILRGAFQSCFIGYKIDVEETNKGYMTEAVQKGIDIMFNRYHLHRIEANIMPSNLPSLTVVKKLGFHEEGLAKKYIKINGKWEDHLHMVILNENQI
jgi:ribosomal-protein-alanine N-acetyltransferase